MFTKRGYRIMGFSLVAVGAMFFLNLFSNMATGFVVFESEGGGSAWFIAIGFLILGIIILFIQRRMKSEEKKIEVGKFDGPINEVVPAVISKN